MRMNMNMQSLPHFINSTDFILFIYIFYIILIILILYNFNNAIPKLPEDGTETPKYVGTFVM
jgi:hypothetical protein